MGLSDLLLRMMKLMKCKAQGLSLQGQRALLNEGGRRERLNGLAERVVYLAEVHLVKSIFP